MFCWLATRPCNNTGFDLTSMNEHKVNVNKRNLLYHSYVSEFMAHSTIMYFDIYSGWVKIEIHGTRFYGLFRCKL